MLTLVTTVGLGLPPITQTGLSHCEHASQPLPAIGNDSSDGTNVTCAVALHASDNINIGLGDSPFLR
jgi:hypothetical protein